MSGHRPHPDPPRRVVLIGMRWLLTAATVLLTTVIFACSDDDATGRTSTPTDSLAPTATPSPTPTTEPTAAPTPDPNSVLMTRGADIPFPDDMAFIIETGCWGCDGTATGLSRVYRDPSGDLRSERIFDPLAMGYPPLVSTSPDGQVHEQAPYLSGPASNHDGSVIAVGVCVVPACSSGGLNGWNADAEAIILHSTDGGITWNEITRGGPALNVVAVVDDRVLTVNYLEPLSAVEYTLFPGNELVEPPAGDSGYPPFSLGDELLWRAPDGSLYLTDGSTFLEGPSNPRELVSVGGVGKGALLIDWGPGAGGEFFNRIMMYEIDDEPLSAKTLFSDEYTTLGPWFPKDDLAVISVAIRPPPEYYGLPIPALLDTSTGEYRLITEEFVPNERPYFPYGRARIRAVQIGPFARVVDTGSCLNVRAEPSLAAQALDCMADGVLLRDFGEMSEADGVTWVRVSTPAGVEGWASAKYLER